MFDAIPIQVEAAYDYSRLYGIGWMKHAPLSTHIAV